MLRKTFLESILKKTPLTDAQIADTLSDQTGDLADDVANAALAAVLTEDEAAASEKITTPIKRTAKAAALDGVDTILKKYTPKLTAAQKTEYDKLGKDSYKQAEYLLTAFDAKGTPTGDEAYNTLKDELEDLKANTVSKTDYDTVSGKVSQAQKKATQSEMITTARLNTKLRDVTSDRHFRTNILSDAENLLSETGVAINDRTRVKGVIDYETGELRKADKPDEAILIGNRKATVSDLVEQTITNEQFGWAKKSDVAGNGSVTVDSDGKSSGRSRAAQKMLDDEANETN